MNNQFIWAVGIEDTFVTQTGKGERKLDEYELTQHYENWREDLDKARESGASMIRYGIPWYRVEPAPNEFNWDWVDEVMEYFSEHPTLTPVIDLVHYGTPHWLKEEFANENYPDAVANYAKVFAERYGKQIKYYTPLNEPYVTAEFCGLNGVWPPYKKGLTGFYSIMTQLSKGIIKTVKEIKKVNKEASFVHVDATKKYFTLEPDLQNEVELWNENGFIMWELIQGRVDISHPLYSFLITHGVTKESLQWFQRNNVTPDIVGVNYYSQFSVHEIKRNQNGFIEYPHVEGTGKDFMDIVKEAYDRYKKPIMITETSYRGTETERIEWLKECVEACEELINIGIPLIGLTWFPFFDLVDWEFRSSGKTVEEELHTFGLYTLVNNNGELKREKNRVGIEFEKMTQMKKIGDE